MHKKSDRRVWKACVACRRKKVKCDGEDPCHGCHSRNQKCEYPETNDNAAASRRDASSLDRQYQNLEALGLRLEGLAQTLSECILAIRGSSKDMELPPDPGSGSGSRSASRTGSLPAEEGTEPDDDVPGNDHPDAPPTPTSYKARDRVGHMVPDSYGRMRYLGGAANNLVIQAVQGLSPSSGHSPHLTQASIPQASVEMPFFQHGQVWPELPYLPSANELARPPQYVADLLVGVYFDQLHYTFPILDKTRFVSQYHAMAAGSPVERGFLSVFFAVCACASGLLPREPGAVGLVGIDYYQKALLLFWASSGEVFLEQAQCLGLLAVCSAGWNTVAQSWRLAGQAVRIAQDLGLHIASLKDPHFSTSDHAADAQVAQRVWWSLFTLDCLTSICLGRPMAATLDDCCCELPSTDGDSAPMSGFVAFTRLCRIAAEVHRIHGSPPVRGGSWTARWQRLRPTVDQLVGELDNWLQDLPDEIRFSANRIQTGPSLTMCFIVFILHSATIMNLYRPLVGQSLSTPTDPSSECISAARSCIQAAELIRERVPPSHHLAFCVQYLTISGILLWTMEDPQTEKPSYHLTDVYQALQSLIELECVWPCASRGRAILERLLQHPRGDASSYLPSLPVLDGLWDPFPSTDTDMAFGGL
ncbi:transcriptional regulator family: Fungal Specific TF [Aspergillus niger]|nr:transcriptional regulator family: Fungal Specific TF [Aspergillus niger]KAI2866099.1 transcriptional regulator family: Fungal Specific TF [Aspergillus niger]KAI2869763.1 transcriptional regulator family: Fungal Specific TF [Aspergillus niger]KAI2900101.1 transcriptional regulator family: Fungal Specific TF [Aspergillus niger]KAI2909307.1 transcriptional regulator family: Fungal Specific TF [Aspergillus niger]